MRIVRSDDLLAARPIDTQLKSRPKHYSTHKRRRRYPFEKEQKEIGKERQPHLTRQVSDLSSLVSSDTPTACLFLTRVYEIAVSVPPAPAFARPPLWLPRFDSASPFAPSTLESEGFDDAEHQIRREGRLRHSRVLVARAFVNRLGTIPPSVRVRKILQIGFSRASEILTPQLRKPNRQGPWSCGPPGGQGEGPRR